MNVVRSTFDLHLHTCWSYDALNEPRVYFEAARRRGVKTLAITEHHVVDSQPEVMAAAREFPEVRVIPAAEMTVTTSIGFMDLLCYGFPKTLTPKLREVMDDYHAWQRAWGAGIVRGMQKLGHDYTEADRERLIRSYRPARTVALQGITHVKNEVQREEFLRRGFLKREEEYWDLILCAWKAGDAPPYPDANKVVPAMKEAGVLVVMAHPLIMFDGKWDQKGMDGVREECRLDGVECSHPSIPAELTPVMRKYCEARRLLSTAGSDCHVAEHIEKWFGTFGGDERWIRDFLERLPRT